MQHTMLNVSKSGTNSLMLGFDDYPEFIPQNLDHSISSEYQQTRSHFRNKLSPIIHLEVPTMRNIQDNSALTRLENTLKSPIAGTSGDDNQPMVTPQTENCKITLIRQLLQPTIETPKANVSPKHKFVRKATNDSQKTKKPRKTQSIMVYYHIKRFLTKISAKRRQKLFFKEKHFTLVGDLASEKNISLSELQSYSGIKIKQLKNFLKGYRQLMNRIQNGIQRLLKPIPLIYPQSATKIMWDCILGLILIYFFVMIPLEIAFNNRLLFGENGICTICFVVFLIMDFIAKMNTIYYEFGQPVTDRAQIIARYFKNGFWIDALSICTLIITLINHYSSDFESINFILFLFFSQGHYFRKIIKDFEESLNLSKEVYSVLQLLKLILTLVYVEHIFSCLWYYLANYEESNGQQNWMSANNLQDESWGIKYINSFYFSTVTMLSVGYGDIVPSSPLEKVLSVMFMMFACVQLSYSVNTVGDLINQLQSFSDESRRRLRIINNFMNNKKISFGLQYQIREYLKIYWSQEFSETTQDEDLIIGMLSENLKNKLIQEANQNILMECSLFKNHFSEESKNKLLKVLKTIVVNPEHIITSNLPAFKEPCLCYLETGDLDVFIRNGMDSELISLHQGQYFGVEEFIKGTQNSIKMTSQKFVKLIVLLRSDFIKIISENTADYQEFCMIRDQSLSNTNPDYIKCDSCLLTGHSIQDCPLIHFQADKERIIKQYQWNITQERQKYARFTSREKNQFRALTDQWALQELCQGIQTQDYPILKFYDQHFKQTTLKDDLTLNARMQEQRKAFQNIHQQQPPSPTPIQSEKTLTSRIKSEEAVPVAALPYSFSPPIRHNHRGSIFMEDGDWRRILVTQSPQKETPRLAIESSRRMLKTEYIPPLQKKFRNTSAPRTFILHRFRSVVQRVIKMNKQSPRKKLPQRGPTSITTRFQRYLADIVKFNQNFQTQVEAIYEQPFQFKLLLNNTEQENGALLLSLYSNNFSAISDFDQNQDYQTYNPNSNIENVLKNCEESISLAQNQVIVGQWFNVQPHKLRPQIRQNILKASLIHYLFFPYEYFNRFLPSEESGQSKQGTVIKRETSKMLSTFKSVSSQIRMKQLSQKFKRHQTPQRSRVTPFEESVDLHQDN